MKWLKKLSYILLIFVLMSVQIVVPELQQETEAKSMKNLRDELAAKEKELADNKNQQAATQKEIQAAKDKITKISKEKEAIEIEISELTEDIKNLNASIVEKNEQIKNLVAYYQLTSTGGDATLEYLLTAQDYTDLVYRYAVSEQLSEYNDDLIDEYERLIIENEQKKKDLNNKKVELNNKTKELEKTLSSLKINLQSELLGALSIEDEIAVLKKTLASYQTVYTAYKCNEDEDYKTCLAKAPKNTLPPDTAFWRPVISGRVSSNYGSRSYTLNGKKVSGFHYGLDFATSRGSNVYAIANGKVVATVNAKASYDKNKKYVCGGNKIFIVHTVNGKDYTSAYYHMKDIKVKVGDVVTKDTVVGTVGGSSQEYWDNCSTGAHVHLQIATGHYQSDYYAYSAFQSKSFNPRNVVNAPALGGSFSNRTTKY